MQTIDIISKIIIPFLGIIISVFLIPYLKSKNIDIKLGLNSSKIKQITDAVAEAVLAAEELGRTKELATGTDKFNYVFGMVKEIADSLGFTEDYIKSLITSKVFELINYKKEK